MGKIFLTVGLIGLCHAAYSATQHRSYMRLTETELNVSSFAKVSSLPLDIVVQTLVSLLLSCFGIIGISTKFRQIKITSEWENKTWDNIANRTSFYSFNHRGKSLYSNSGAPEPLTGSASAASSPFTIASNAAEFKQIHRDLLNAKKNNAQVLDNDQDSTEENSTTDENESSLLRKRPTAHNNDDESDVENNDDVDSQNDDSYERDEESDETDHRHAKKK